MDNAKFNEIKEGILKEDLYNAALEDWPTDVMERTKRLVRISDPIQFLHVYLYATGLSEYDAWHISGLEDLIQYRAELAEIDAVALYKSL